MTFISARQRWYQYLNAPSSSSKAAWTINLFIAAAVISNMLEILLVSVDTESLLFQYDRLSLLHLFTVVFFLDYCLRVWVAADAPIEHGGTGSARRRAYILSPMGLVDLLSFLPSLILYLLPDSEFQNFSFLKVLAVIRILKLTRYSASLSILARVYQENMSTLFAAMIIMLILSFTAATGVYTFEHALQPEALGSIPKALWWAIVTLTTVGYGDVVPITLGGKLFGAFVMIAGVGIAAIPAGIFASSFVRLIRENDRHARIQSHRNSMTTLNKASISALNLSNSDKREVEFLIDEYELSLEQAISVVEHYREVG